MSDIQYQWNFNPLEIVYQEDTMQDVISAVHWQLQASYTSSQSSSFIQTSFGKVEFGPPNPNSFIPFVDVTKELVTGWVESSMGESRINLLKTGLSSSIAYQIHPSSGTVSPPWE